MEPKLEPVAKDERGESWRVLFPDNREALLIFTKKGFLRGGHSHSNPEISLILTGKVRNWKIVDGCTELINDLSAGNFMINQPGEPHLTLALEDYWILDWKIDAQIGEWTTTDYEPYRKRVRDQLNSKEPAGAEGTKSS